MKRSALISLIAALLSGCSDPTQTEDLKKADTAQLAVIPKSYDRQQDLIDVQTLIRRTLVWADTHKATGDEIVKDSICVGFDLSKHTRYLNELKNTGFFADEFINNYDRILRTIDQKIRNKEYKPWNVYELPTFRFANDVSPWCNCQDNMSWDAVTITPLKFDAGKGDLTWHWGGIDGQTDPSWKEFTYRFKVIKVDGEWKIACMQGFDYEQAIKADGEV